MQSIPAKGDHEVKGDGSSVIQKSLPYRSSCYRSRPSQEKGVRFLPKVLILIVENHSRQGNKLWYTDQDYDQFYMECAVSATKLDNHIRLNPKKFSRIGLESWTKLGFQRQQQNRVETVKTVLDEQFAQWDDGVDDVETIAELYQASARHAQMVANTRALILQRETQRIYAKAIQKDPELFGCLQPSSYMAAIRSLTVMTADTQSQRSHRSARIHIDSLSQRSNRTTTPDSLSQRSNRTVGNSSSKRSHRTINDSTSQRSHRSTGDSSSQQQSPHRTRVPSVAAFQSPRQSPFTKKEQQRRAILRRRAASKSPKGVTAQLKKKRRDDSAPSSDTSEQD